MRISGGELKRRELKTPKGNDTRPTSGITKESIFNIIGTGIKDLTVLDLFSGSGALGIEALSRGAAFSIFVEKEKLPLKCIHENILKLSLGDKTKILKKELPSQIKSIFMDKKPDLIFMDPPYSKGLVNPTLKALEQTDLINKKTMVIVEHSRDEVPDNSFFEVINTRKYGKSLVSFLNYMI